MSDSSEEPEQTDAVAEVLSDLRMYHEANLPVELWFDDDEYCEGLVSAIGEDFVLIARLWQRSWLNGLRAVRLTAIQEVLPSDDEEFVSRALIARAETLPPVSPLQASTMTDVVGSVCGHYPIVILVVKPPNEEPSDVAGSVISVHGGVARMQLISKAGFWMPEPEEITIGHVTEVLFGSEYEKTLQQIGALADAHGKPQGPQDE